MTIVNIVSQIETGHRGIKHTVVAPPEDSHYKSPLYREQGRRIVQGNPNVTGDGLDYILSQLEVGKDYELLFRIDGIDLVSYFNELVNIQNNGLLIEWSTATASGTNTSWTDFYENNWLGTGQPIWDFFPSTWDNDEADNPNFYRLELKITELPPVV